MTASLTVRALPIEGAYELKPRIHADSRGSFLEWYRHEALREAVGYPLQLAQANGSVSTRGVIRGVHFADVPPGQAKYVTCVAGEVLDVVVDLRSGSPTFGRWEAVRLDDVERRAVYVSEGLGHAFCVLSDSATVVYLCSAVYTPRREHGVHPLDPALSLPWPTDRPLNVSDRDAAAPTLAEAAAGGLLPRFADCLAYTAELRNNAGSASISASSQ